LRTTFSDEEAAKTIVIRYVVVNTSSAYNLLLGRPLLNNLGAVASTKHMKMKLSSLEGRVITIGSNQKDARKCYESSLKSRRSYNVVAISQGRKVAEVLETELSHRPRPRKGDRTKIVQARCLYGAGAARPDSWGDS